jgi:hypothetical protein
MSMFPSRVSELVEEYANIFQVRLDDAPPADVPGVEIRLKDTAKPVKAKGRKCIARLPAFIAQYCDKFVENSLAVRIGTAD